MPKILPIPNYTPHIGVLVNAMVLARRNTFFLVKGLSVKALDYNLDRLSNSIGTLLLHICTLEFEYTSAYLTEKPPSKEEWSKFEDALPENMANGKIKNNDLNYYVNELVKVRDLTLQQLKKRNDEWLFKDVKFQDGFIANNYYLLRHIIDDEISHQGQIKWILKRINRS